MEATKTTPQIDWAQLIRDGRFNAYRQAHPEIAPNLSDLNLGGMVLEGLDFHSCRFVETSLVRTDFHHCNCMAAEFTGANLEGAQFLDQTDCSDAIFDGANLQDALFAEGSLRGASLHRADLHCCSFTEMDCTDLKIDANLDTVDFVDCLPEGFGPD